MVVRLVRVIFSRDLFFDDECLYRKGEEAWALVVLNNYNHRHIQMDEGPIFGYLILDRENLPVNFVTGNDVEDWVLDWPQDPRE